MKILKLLITLLCVSANLFVFSQKKNTIVIKKSPKEIDFLPNIGGVYHGEIDIALLCSSVGIENNIDYKVFSYKITYVKNAAMVTEKVVSSELPDSICGQIAYYNMNYEVFFTEIKALDYDGRLIRLESFSLIPIRNEDDD